MSYEKIEFSCNYMETLHSDDDVIISRFKLLHTGRNINQCDILSESIPKSISSFYNKAIIYKLNNEYFPKDSSDVVEHSRDMYDTTMNIAGHIVESGGFELKTEEDGKEYLYMIGVIHKLYQPVLTNIIKNRNGNMKVSIEIKPLVAYRDADGVLVIQKFKLLGVCLLGEGIQEGIKGSKMQVLKYSSEEYNDKYLNFSKESFIMNSLGTKPAIKMDKSKESLSTATWGDVDKTVLRNKILEAKNFKTLVKSVYLLVLDGWEDSPSTKLKYPVMEFKNGKLVYNRYALSSALAYAKGENEQSVVNKITELYKKLDLIEEDGEKVDNIVENATLETVENSEAEIVENAVEEKEESEVEKVEVEKDDDEEIDYKAKFKDLEMKCNALQEEVKKYQRKEEEDKMFSLIEEYSHCFSKEDKELFKSDVEKSDFASMESKINEKVRDFAKSVKEPKVEVEKDVQSFSMGLGIKTEEVKLSDRSLESYVKKSTVKIG